MNKNDTGKDVEEPLENEATVEEAPCAEDTAADAGVHMEDVPAEAGRSAGGVAAEAVPHANGAVAEAGRVQDVRLPRRETHAGSAPDDAVRSVVMGAAGDSNAPAGLPAQRTSIPRARLLMAAVGACICVALIGVSAWSLVTGGASAPHDGLAELVAGAAVLLRMGPIPMTMPRRVPQAPRAAPLATKRAPRTRATRTEIPPLRKTPRPARELPTHRIAGLRITRTARVARRAAARATRRAVRTVTRAVTPAAVRTAAPAAARMAGLAGIPAPVPGAHPPTAGDRREALPDRGKTSPKGSRLPSPPMAAWAAGAFRAL